MGSQVRASNERQLALGRRWSLLAGAVALGAPAAALAHARWFAPDGLHAVPDWSLLASTPVLIGVLAAALVVALLTGLERWLGDPLWPRPGFLQRMEPAAPAILGVQTAITVIFAATRLQLFVPNIQLPRNLIGMAIAGLAILASFSFVTGILTRWGAVLLIGIWALGFVVAPWYEVLEQVVFVGIALYLLSVGRGVTSYQEQAAEKEPAWMVPIRHHALTLLRVGAAASLIMLALTEKLVAPGLGLAFLQEYPHFNVGRELGIGWFTDERFVYAIGIIELVAGVALLSGRLIRLVILVLWLPFNLGIPFLPAEEMIGHLPVLATMYVLLVRGNAGIPPPDDAAAEADDPFAPQRPAREQATADPR